MPPPPLVCIKFYIQPPLSLVVIFSYAYPSSFPTPPPLLQVIIAQSLIFLQGFVFKPKYWAICLKIYIYVLFFSLLLHRLAVRIRFAVSYFSTGLIVLTQVYNWEIRHHSLVC